jgi:flagellar basal-body rod protein FlgG
MNPGLKASASGMRAQQLRIDAIANNLANVNTTGFKRSRVTFQDLLYETLQGTRLVNYQNVEAMGPVQVGRGVRVVGNARVHSQGSLEPTQRLTDVAIQGEGLFMIEMPDSTVAYTRDGTFSIADTGALVNQDGFAVLGLNENAILLPPGTSGVLSISPTGQVSVDQAGEVIPIGEIALTRFLNPSGLESLGGNLYRRTDAAGEGIVGLPHEFGFGQLVQGYLETSNVEIVQEMVDMIAAQRAYEVNSKAIQTAEEMIENAINGLNR